MSTATALRLAGQHPQAMLPCPACACSLRAANLERHLAKSHAAEPTAAAAPAWADSRGLSNAELSIDGDALALRTRSGLRTRRAPLAGPVEVGALVATGTSSLMSSYTDDYPTLAEPTSERVGVFLAIGGIAVGCGTSTDVRKHWTGFAQSAARRKGDISLAPADFVALQYALADRGLLALRGEPPG